MTKTICVYCSSSEAVPSDYFKAAEELGRSIAKRGYTLVFGGGEIGLMGALARAATAYKGRVVGVIPERLASLAYERADEMIVTKDLRERKAVMEERADAFVALPGGFGTLEELLEALTLKQLSYHNKPIVLVNTAGFYDPLADIFERIYAAGFTKAVYRELYHIADDSGDALPDPTDDRIFSRYNLDQSEIYRIAQAARTQVEEIEASLNGLISVGCG